ncbi:hypothetical protein CAEBREN_01391 [Caenorhabditis brenneri]|uniref:Uncharacterized protein n=1 Tax=Caenorhabditis brenneri TaxID=135651 RepID=G0MDC3_CAEBE|nr:hypothetical protein CAEBREN_01391 [Caenorhabditis brenneri]
MSNAKPLGYDSLKAVLPYMKVNQRYEMSYRMPSLKHLDKLLPSRFDCVEFDFCQTRVNDTTYRLGLVRQYPEGYDVPMSHKQENDEGGKGMDMTEHGFDQMLYRHVITPGDVDIAPGQLIPQDGRVHDDNRVLYERHVQAYEKALALRLEQGDEPSNNDPIGNEGYDQLLGINLLAGAREKRLLRHVLQFSTGSIRKKLEDYKAKLVPFHCREHNTPLPFVPMIQLTVSSPEGTKIYRHAYNMKLQEAMKELNTKLFGNRDGVHHISSLILKQPVMVIRLPVGFRVTVGGLSIAGAPNLNLKALQSFAEESSYPIKMLEMTGRFLRIVDYDYPKVKSARTLIIENGPQVLDLLPFIRSLQNQNVIFKCHVSALQAQQQVILVENWIDSEMEIGRTLSLELLGMPSVRYLLSQIELRFLGNRGHENMVIMPMRNGNNLQVTCIRLNNLPPRHDLANWRIEMKVVPGAEEEEY